MIVKRRAVAPSFATKFNYVDDITMDSHYLAVGVAAPVFADSLVPPRQLAFMPAPNPHKAQLMNVPPGEASNDLFKLILLNEDEETIFRTIDSQDPNIVDPTGFTPLHYAVKLGLTNVARKLVERGADIHAVNKFNGKTPFHLAEENENHEMVNFFRAHHVVAKK